MLIFSVNSFTNPGGLFLSNISSFSKYLNTSKYFILFKFVGLPNSSFNDFLSSPHCAYIPYLPFFTYKSLPLYLPIESVVFLFVFVFFVIVLFSITSSNITTFLLLNSSKSKSSLTFKKLENFPYLFVTFITGPYLPIINELLSSIFIENDCTLFIFLVI